MKQILFPALAIGLAACGPEAQKPPVVPAVETPVVVSDPCVRSGYDRKQLDALKAKDFEIADDAERQAFAKAITACLASPDPDLRDGIAYEALMHMLREKQLTPETMKGLVADLTARLKATEGEGFERPFAALALSEVARADHIEAYLSDEELRKLVSDAQAYFIAVNDYRGFDEQDGWRHGVAHGADLLMQLALNPRLDKKQLGQIVTAVAVQIAPRGETFIHGESERLARPILAAASHDAMTKDQWKDWLVRLAAPPTDLSDRLFKSLNGLAWRHNTLAFLEALYVSAALGSDKEDDVLLPGLEAALKAMPS